MTAAISVQGLGKKFRRYRADRPMTLQEAVLRGLRGLQPVEQFWALQEISFEIAAGQMVGVIGHNGAGKSTLLRLIGGVGRPDQGSLKVQGRIGALLDLGAGFHPDLTGRENVFINGVISGLTRREVAQRLDEIIEFAELPEFIDSPLRTYSTGMQLRLAFAVAAHIEPEILLIDEVLAVGDISFQRKCLDRIARFKQEGHTILLVSHDIAAVRQLCDEVVWLRGGQIAMRGPASVVVDQYRDEMTRETRRSSPTPPRPPLRTASGVELQINQNRFGSLEMEIVTARLLDSTGSPVAQLESGQPLQVEIEYFSPHSIPAPIFGVTITREDGFICFDTYNLTAGLNLPPLQGQGQIKLWLERLDLNGGQYYVDVSVHEQNWAHLYDYHWHAYPLIVYPVISEKGLLSPPHHWESVTSASTQADVPILEAA